MILTLLTAPPARAALTTCQTGGNYHVGYYGPGSTGRRFEGAAADITIRYGEVCDQGDQSSTNFTNSYSMIAGASGGWAQTGFIRWWGGPMLHFGQQFDGVPAHGANTRYSVGSPGVGEVYHYSQNWNGNCHCVVSYVNNTVWLQSTWNPVGTWQEPFSPQFMGETRYQESDVPGYSSGANSSPPTLYNSVIGQDFVTNQWFTMPCGLLVGNESLSSHPWVAASTDCHSLRTYTVG